MSQQQNGFHFDIPIPVIIIALIFSFPIGVILAVLRLVSSSDGDKKGKGTERKKGTTLLEYVESEVQKQKKFAGAETESQSGKRNAFKKGKITKRKRSVGTVLSTVICAVAFVIGVLGVVMSFSDGIGRILENLVSYALPFMTVSGVSYLASLFFKDRDSRFNRIRAIIGEKESLHLSKIAAVSRQNMRKVRRDVQKMIDNGEFGNEAYIDLGTDNFMRYADAKPDADAGFDYRTMYDESIFGKHQGGNREASVGAETERSDVARKDGDVGRNSSDQDNFRSIILQIRRLNDEIHDFTVSEKIYRIEEYTQYIFDYVTEHSDAMPKIRTFMNYYLPTTLKLLESYKRIERMGATGENMKSSKEKIERILDLLVEGYKQQMDNLFQNESMDISSDISVLETMMQKDGLSGNKAFSPAIEFDLGGMAAQQMPTDTEADTK